MSKARLLTGNRAEVLLQLAADFRRDIAVGAELLALTERTPEQERDVFEFKRRVIKRVVKRVDVLPDKSTEVHVRLRLGETSEQPADDIVN